MYFQGLVVTPLQTGEFDISLQDILRFNISVSHAPNYVIGSAQHLNMFWNNFSVLTYELVWREYINHYIQEIENALTELYVNNAVVIIYPRENPIELQLNAITM